MTPASLTGRDRLNDLLSQRPAPTTAADEVDAGPANDTAASMAEGGGTRPRSAFADLMSLVERRDPPSPQAVGNIVRDPSAATPPTPRAEGPVVAGTAVATGSSARRATGDADAKGESGGAVAARDAHVDLPGFLRMLPPPGHGPEAGDAVRPAPKSIKGARTKDAEAKELPSTDLTVRLPAFLAPHDRRAAPPATPPADASPATVTVPVVSGPAQPTIPAPQAQSARRDARIASATSPIAHAHAVSGKSATPERVAGETASGLPVGPSADAPSARPTQPGRAGQLGRLVGTGTTPATSTPQQVPVVVPQATPVLTQPPTSTPPPEARTGRSMPRGAGIELRRSIPVREEATVGRHPASRREAADMSRRGAADGIDAVPMLPKPIVDGRMERFGPSADPGPVSVVATAAGMPDPATVQASAGSAPDPTSGAALPALRQPVGTDAWQDELSAQLSFMSEQGDRSEAVMKLAPEELGELEIRVELRQGEAALQFGAVNAEARQALELAQPRLREMFASQGLNVTDFKIFSTLSGNPQSESRHEERSPRGRRLTSEVDPGVSVTVSARRSNGAVDLYA